MSKNADKLVQLKSLPERVQIAGAYEPIGPLIYLKFNSQEFSEALLKASKEVAGDMVKGVNAKLDVPRSEEEIAGGALNGVIMMYTLSLNSHVRNHIELTIIPKEKADLLFLEKGHIENVFILPVLSEGDYFQISFSTLTTPFKENAFKTVKEALKTVGVMVTENFKNSYDIINISKESSNFLASFINTELMKCFKANQEDNTKIKISRIITDYFLPLYDVIIPEEGLAVELAGLCKAQQEEIGLDKFKALISATGANFNI